jgi:hypothetical protein
MDGPGAGFEIIVPSQFSILAKFIKGGGDFFFLLFLLFLSNSLSLTLL